MTQREKDAIEALREKDTDLCEALIREGICLPEFAEVAWQNHIFRPAQLYENAPDKVRDEMIKILENDLEDDDLYINGLLIALAAIGDSVVAECFTRWEKNQKKWRNKLHVGPTQYALEGDWCIDNGEIRKLFYEESYALVETKEDVLSVFGGASKQECPFCESSYQDIIVLDGTDPRLSFLNADGIIKIKSCLCCLPWSSPIISTYEVNGEGKVIVHEGEEEFDYIDDESMNDHETYTLSKHKVPLHFCTEWEGSAIGGKPKFVDDANFAKCPKCGKYMKHIAQLDGEITGFSGTVYVQICTDCRTAASWYQES